MTVAKGCTADCMRTPECARCGKTKKLRGRDYPMSASSGYCDWECAGYNEQPIAGHLWPSEWRDHEAGDHSGCMDCDAEVEP